MQKTGISDVPPALKTKHVLSNEGVLVICHCTLKYSTPFLVIVTARAVQFLAFFCRQPNKALNLNFMYWYRCSSSRIQSSLFDIEKNGLFQPRFCHFTKRLPFVAKCLRVMIFIIKIGRFTIKIGRLKNFSWKIFKQLFHYIDTNKIIFFNFRLKSI